MLKKVLLLFVFLSASNSIFALCAQCKAVAEQNGGEWGNGLNGGIMLLAMFPYIILVGILFLAFKGKIVSGIKNFINS